MLENKNKKKQNLVINSVTEEIIKLFYLLINKVNDGRVKFLNSLRNNPPLTSINQLIRQNRKLIGKSIKLLVSIMEELHSIAMYTVDMSKHKSTDTSVKKIFFEVEKRMISLSKLHKTFEKNRNSKKYSPFFNNEDVLRPLNILIQRLSQMVIEGKEAIKYNDPQAERKQILEILKANGYDCLSILGQGTYNTVVQCINPEGYLVAARVATGNGVNVVTEALKILNSIKPPNLDSKKCEELANRFNIEKPPKNSGYYKYTDVGKPIKTGQHEHYFISEAPLMTGNALETLLEIAETTEKKFNEIIIIIKNILKSLKYLHNRGWVHLDIKPGNILGKKTTEKTGFYKLSDFDLMVKTGKRNSSKDIAWRGSTPFQAPEQREYIKTGKELELNPKKIKSIDIWAVGATALALYRQTILKRQLVDMIGPINELHSGKYPIKNMLSQEKIFFDTIKKFTEPNPGNRPTAAEALNYPLFKKPVKII